MWRSITASVTQLWLLSNDRNTFKACAYARNGRRAGFLLPAQQRTIACARHVRDACRASGRSARALHVGIVLLGCILRSPLSDRPFASPVQTTYGMRVLPSCHCDVKSRSGCCLHESRCVGLFRARNRQDTSCQIRALEFCAATRSSLSSFSFVDYCLTRLFGPLGRIAIAQQ